MLLILVPNVVSERGLSLYGVAKVGDHPPPSPADKRCHCGFVFHPTNPMYETPLKVCPLCGAPATKLATNSKVLLPSQGQPQTSGLLRSNESPKPRSSDCNGSPLLLSPNGLPSNTRSATLEAPTSNSKCDQRGGTTSSQQQGGEEYKEQAKAKQADHEAHDQDAKNQVAEETDGEADDKGPIAVSGKKKMNRGKKQRRKRKAGGQKEDQLEPPTRQKVPKLENGSNTELNQQP